MITHPVLSRLAEHGGMKLGLERVTAFLASVGDPHLAVPVVHVAGTNGKGSVCAMVTEALVAAGLRVGTNTSPHLEHVNERIRLDGVPIDDARFTAAIEQLDRARWAWAASQGLDEAPLTYFELVTALAFQVFAAERVDVAVIEVGLGGRLDATNVVRPEVCAITSLGLDHVAELGPTIPGIAREKAGILKPGVPGVVGPVPPDALAAIREVAGSVGAPLWTCEAELGRERTPDGWRLSTPDGRLGPVALAMPGAHQGGNAAVAVGVLHQLRRRGFDVPDAAIVAGLARARVGGRIERLRPGLVLDGAHNPDGTAALAAWLGEQPRPRRRVLLFGMGHDREPADVLGPLLPHVDEVVLTRCAHPKARTPGELAAALGPLDVPVRVAGDVEGCLADVIGGADETIVAGSLYLVGAVRTLVGGA